MVEFPAAFSCFRFMDCLFGRMYEKEKGFAAGFVYIMFLAAAVPLFL